MRMPCRSNPRAGTAALRRALLALAAVCLVALPARAAPDAPAPFVMGSIQREDNYAGRWMGQIYAEAFRRLD